MSQPVQEKSKSQTVRILGCVVIFLLVLNLILISNYNNTVLLAAVVLSGFGFYLLLDGSDIGFKALATKQNILAVAKFLAIALAATGAAAAVFGLIIHLGVE